MRVKPRQGSGEVLRIKAAVRKRDGFCCTMCGMTNEEHRKTHGQQLEVHRLVPGSLYAIPGCATVCKGCHKDLPRSRHGTAEGPVRLIVNVPPDLRAALRLAAVRAGKGMSDLADDLLKAALADALEEIRRQRSGL
jgi:5-methylcytosine-specific restriction endonuclease McrA